eukprot:scaffold19168_cov107-Isochrysis_galbana.AAC.1
MAMEIWKHAVVGGTERGAARSAGQHQQAGQQEREGRNASNWLKRWSMLKLYAHALKELETETDVCPWWPDC